MRVLYVNWVDYLDTEARGGGVSLYQRNLMAERPEHDTLFLASGTSYDLRHGPPRWEQIRHGPKKDRSRRFEIVNSGVMAPAHVSFGDPAQVKHPPTEATFFDFLSKHGPFDIVHFNNLEGLPATVLRLKERFPNTRVIFSLHNYYPICPQVNLWQQERAHCADFEGGKACATCLIAPPASRSIRMALGLAYRLKCWGLEPGSIGYNWSVRILQGLGRRLLRGVRAFRKKRPISATPDTGFADRRLEMVDALNTGCDQVLCVSDAVRSIAISYGIEPDLAQTCYIGSAQASLWGKTEPRPFPQRQDGLTIAYIGYMRRDKGFFFLLDALEQAPDDLLAKTRLVIAAGAGGADTQARLEALRPRLGALNWYDGYRHSELDHILSEVDVGIVPPLWADNLPQVAIEMHSRHIPILCSNQGGSQELADFPAMVFPAGDDQAFRERLRALIAGEIDMGAYWRAAQAPTTMRQHIAQLEAIYADTCSRHQSLTNERHLGPRE